MRMRKGFAKLHGKIIPYKTSKHDFKDYRNCPECHRKNVLAGFPYRRQLIKPSEQVKLDNGKIWCRECASKLTNQK